MTYNSKPSEIVIETDFFDGAPNNVKFGVAISRLPDEPGRSGLLLPVEDEAAVRLVQVSYQQAGIIANCKEDLARIRALDHRSERIVVMERVGKRAASLFATARLVHGTLEESLPMEEYFPSLLCSVDIPRCVEISRLTSIAEDKKTRERLSSCPKSCLWLRS
ncbi:MAG: hypothetical protein H6799_00495 [Candidatus Nomurabacteria bacterium]|nr:MAG: hypothetical protein H6799_00495 [Candidatus Nomurabacteria bacterium]HRV76218.1 hypothetical protein [Candidatus Saccharimonadales bacterium]